MNDVEYRCLECHKEINEKDNFLLCMWGFECSWL